MTALMIAERWAVPKRTVDYWGAHGRVALLFDLPGARVYDALSALAAVVQWRERTG